MSRLTDVRHALAAALESLDAEVIVASAPTKTAEEGERFTIRLTVGEICDESQKKLDLLLDPDAPDSIAALLKADPELGGAVEGQQVVSHAGWRVFERRNEPPLLGTELTVQAYL